MRRNRFIRGFVGHCRLRTPGGVLGYVNDPHPVLVRLPIVSVTRAFSTDFETLTSSDPS